MVAGATAARMVAKGNAVLLWPLPAYPPSQRHATFRWLGPGLTCQYTLRSPWSFHES